jgi:serine/threonine-protein kinase
MPPVIPGGAGDPYAAPDPMTTTAQVEPVRKGGVLKGLGVAVLIIALLGVGVWLGVRLLGSTAAETVAVPRLEGLTVAKAESELRDLGLLLGGPEVKVSDLPKDTIISQDPRTGELVEVGSIVDVVVSAGKEQVQVPDLIDFTSESDARRALAEAGLTLGKVAEEDSDRPEGTVLRQDPAPYETVDAGSAVDIWVSNAQVEVPNVVGRTEAQARTDLFNLGFEVAYGPELETTEFAPGTVADQTPVGGENAKKGSLVTLTLAKAPAPTPTPTPTPSVPADGGGADGSGGGGTANGNPGLSATPAP